LHAGFAADAAIFVEIHDAVIPRIKRLNGANFNAGGVGTVVATHHGKEASGMRKFALFHLLHPRPVDANRHLMLTFTSGGASMTTNAFSVVNDKTVFHYLIWF